MQRPFAHRALELPGSAGTLGERGSKMCLAAYGIPVVREIFVPLEGPQDYAALDVSYPVAVKVESPDLPHKTEAGAVRLGVADARSLALAAQQVVANARRYQPGARIDGVLVQEMAQGTEALLGAINDSYFGPVVLFGAGGVATELLKDVSHRFAPFDLQTAREMIDEIRLAPLFNGYRGRPALDVDALADALVRLSWLIADHADRIAEIDVNPLFVRPAGEGVVAADALVVTKPAATVPAGAR